LVKKNYEDVFVRFDRIRSVVKVENRR